MPPMNKMPVFAGYFHNLRTHCMAVIFGLAL